MKPDAPADPTQRLRQQLILAQVRLMELEDTRDALAPRADRLEQLLAAAQTLADQKTDEAAHLAHVREELQAQFAHMRHMQHVTNEALEATRAQLAAARQAQSGLLLEVGHLDQQLRSLTDELDRALAESRRHQARIAQLDRERTAMKTSRSWRWTAWLRSLERALARRHP
jgi:chromosome segregation ATPase